MGHTEGGGDGGGDNGGESESGRPGGLRPPSVWIVGPPGSGKTTLARSICERLGTVHIDVVTLAEREIARKTKLGMSLDRVLRSGSLIPHDAIIKLLEEAVQSDEAAYRGFVLDGFPDSLASAAWIRRWGRCPEYLVRINFDEDGLRRRRTALRFDSASGYTFSRTDLDPLAPFPVEDLVPRAEPLRAPKPEGDDAANAANDEEDDLADLEEEEQEEEDAAAAAGGDGAGSEGEEEAEEDEAEEAARAAEGGLPVPVKRRPPNPKRVKRNKLLVRPEDFEREFDESFRLYVNRAASLAPLLSLYRPERVLDLDGRLPAPDLAETVALKWEHLRPVPEPTAVEAPDFPSVEAARETLETEGTEETGPRRLAVHGEYCPVELHINGKLVPGLPEFNTIFKGEVYVCSSAQCRDMFMANPAVYLSRPPSVDPRSLRILIVGPPLSGATTQARLLAEYYGVRHLSVPHLAAELMRSMLASGAKTPRTNRVRNALRDGGVVPGTVYVEAVVRAIEAEQDRLSDIEAKLEKLQARDEQGEGSEPASEDDDDGRAEGQQANDLVALSGEFGWVLEGLPLDPTITQALARLGALPHRVIVLEDGSGGAELAARALRLGVEPERGRTVRVAPPHPSEESPISLPPAPLPAGAQEESPRLAATGPAGAAADRDHAEEDDETLRARMDALAMAPLPLASLPAALAARVVGFPVEPMVERYNATVEEVLAPFRAAELPVVTVPCQGTLADVTGLIRREVDPFFPTATAAPQLSGLRPREMVLGETGSFCPVTLKSAGVLVAGSPDCGALFRGEAYLCASEAELERFLSNPRFYLPRTPVPVPPPRLFIVGPKGCGKTTQARALGARFGLPVLSIDDTLRDFVLDHPADPLSVKVGRLALRDLGADLGALSAGDAAAAAAEDSSPDRDPDAEEDAAAEILSRVLVSEPYASRGYIAEGLPLSARQVDVLTGKKLFPDAAVALQLSAERALKRRLPADREAALDQRARDAAAKTWDAERAAERAERDPSEPAPTAADRRAEAKERAETLDRAVAEAKEARRDAVSGETEAANDAASAFVEHLAGLGVKTLTTPADRTTRQVTAAICTALAKFLDERSGLFAVAVPLTRQVAEARLRAFHCSLSKWGRNCPVEAVVSDRLSGVFSSPKFPVQFRGRIYFPQSRHHRALFLANPVKYTAAPTKPLPAVAPSVAVIGPPLSGKTTVSKVLAARLGCIRLSPRVALEIVLRSDTELKQRVSDTFLRRGFSVPDKDVVEALRYAMSTARFLRRGWVLDGFPVTASQGALLDEAGIVPHKVMLLEAGAKVMLERAARAREARQHARAAEAEAMAAWVRDGSDEDAKPAINPALAHVLLDSDDAHLARASAFHHTLAGLTALYGQRRGNLLRSAEGEGLWRIAHRTESAELGAVLAHRRYLWAVARDEAAAALELCRTPKTVEDGEGHFGRYCPVSLASRTHKELHLAQGEGPTAFTAEYRGKYFHMRGPAELALFLDEPERYLSGSLPEELPVHLQPMLSRRREDFQLQGYCPVTLADPTRSGYDSIVLGDLERHAVRYSERNYALRGPEELAAFMKAPWLYDSLTLPHKIPAPPEEPVLDTLPIHGYLEQVIAAVLTKGLATLATTRPVFPYLSPKESALKHLALFLKANSPLKDETMAARKAKKLKDFEGYCNLVTYLKKNSPLLNPHLNQTPQSLALYERRADLFDRVRDIDLDMFFN